MSAASYLKTLSLSIIAAMTLASLLRPQKVLFRYAFKGKLGAGWAWVREHREAWRVTEHGLEVRIEPGNMWGPQNNARNLLIREQFRTPDAKERNGSM